MAALLLFVLAADALDVAKNYQKLRPVPPGAQVPDSRFTLLDGSRIRLADFSGKVILLSFWATWCPTCRREMPVLDKLQKEYSDAGLIVIGMNRNDQDEYREVKAFVQKHGYSYRQAWSSYKYTQHFKVKTLPTTVLIDRQGRIVDLMVGAVSESTLRDKIGGLL